LKMPKVWEIIENFKSLCRSRGWKTSDDEDWIEIDDKYHNFLSTKEIPISSFKRIAHNGKCVVREGLSYRVVRASYSAWLFSESPPEALTKTMCENPEFANRIALYDLSPLLEGKSLCAKMNHTDSPVFQEFEAFLQNELKVKLEPLPAVCSSEDKVESLVTAEAA